MPRGFALAASLSLALAAGCGGSDSGDAPTPASAGEASAPAPAAAPVATSAASGQAEAEQIFATRCFTCHGPNGEGDGPGSAALTPKPRNFRDATWAASVTDDHLANIIKYGGAAVGKSPAMPGNPDLMARPDVVQALIAHIRSLSAAQ
jgi:mono/diheme cytochrome c family protein